MLSKLLRWSVAVLAFLVALRIGYFNLATVFRTWDDEGYLLLSIKHYMAGGHLYTQVFTQYGPLFYLIQAFLFRIFHQPVTHDGGRFITLILWLAASLVAAFFLYRFSRNIFIAAAAGLSLMAIASSVLVNEPDHPQHIIFLLLMIACCAWTMRVRRACLLLGAIGVALLFIKINIGVFFFAALFATVVCGLSRGPLRKLGAALFLAYFLLAPVVLMHRDVHTWAAAYCTVAVLCGAPTFLATLFASARPLRARSTLPYISTGAALLLVVVALDVAAHHMSFHTLIHGVLLDPLQQPKLFELPWKISIFEIVIPLVAMAIISAFYWPQYRAARDTRWIHLVSGTVAILFVIMTVFVKFSVLAPTLLLLPLGLLPGEHRRWSEPQSLPRVFVALLAASELLGAYPVAGSQVVYATAPVALWALLCIADAVTELQRRFPALTPARGGYPAPGTTLGVMLLLCAEIQALIPRAWRPLPYTASTLHGAAWLHLYPATERALDKVTTDVTHNCDMLFTLPGMGSFNLWSQTPSPNGMFLTTWVKALSDDQQQEILRILSADPNACVVVKPRNIWQATPSDLAGSPLARYILSDMRLVSVGATYQIRVNPNRTRAWIESTPRAAADQHAQAVLVHTPRTVLPAE